MKKPKKADITVAKLRDLKAELKEEHEWRKDLHATVDRLETERADVASRNLFLVQTLGAERGCLRARLVQIDLAVALLKER